MISSKPGANVVFACLVVALAFIAATSIYKNSSRPTNSTAANSASSGTPLPANHPPIETAKEIAALEQMSAKDPQNAALLTQIANICFDAGQYEKAADFYQKSLGIRPKDASVETDLATCFHYLGQHDRALETLNGVLGYSPNFTQALLNKGIVLASGKKDAKGAIAVWEDLLRVDPGFSKRAELEQSIRQLKASSENR